MNHPTCDQNHRYVIATEKSISDVFNDPAEVKNYLAHQAGLQFQSPMWVAFHDDVPVEHLIENPETTQLYCAVETARVEASTELTRS